MKRGYTGAEHDDVRAGVHQGVRRRGILAVYGGSGGRVVATTGGDDAVTLRGEALPEELAKVAEADDADGETRGRGGGGGVGHGCGQCEGRPGFGEVETKAGGIESGATVGRAECGAAGWRRGE